VLRRELRDRAVRDATEVLRQFAETARRASGALLAVDVAGNVIAANEAARAFFTDLPEGPVLDPAQRHREGCPELRAVARKSAERARGEPDWVGGADLGFLVGGDNKVFSIAAVRSPDDVIGLLLAEDANRDIEKVDDEPAPVEVANLPKRIPAVRAERIILLPPEEIRYAVAARHDVWFITDRGRVRAATHGIDNVERELAPFGFMRVHRSYVVNLGRIREVGERPNGALTLSTDLQRQEAIAVSRRCAIKLRQQLGF
jgi:DNA-binding LytR/AlgR family response regulator